MSAGPNTVFEGANLAMLKQEPRWPLSRRGWTTSGVNWRMSKRSCVSSMTAVCGIAEYQRDKELQEASYRKYTESLEQTHIDHAEQLERISNIAVAQPATYEAQPVRTRWQLSLVVGFVFALFGSIGLTFLLNYFGHSVKDSATLAKQAGPMGLPDMRQEIDQRNGSSGDQASQHGVGANAPADRDGKLDPGLSPKHGDRSRLRNYSPTNAWMRTWPEPPESVFLSTRQEHKVWGFTVYVNMCISA